MIVVDTNIVIYSCLASPYGELALALLERDSDWHAPTLWRSEMRNFLAGAMRRSGLSLAQAFTAMEDAERRMGGNIHGVSSDAVLRLAGQTDCTAYDLEFVALAQELRVPLITMDRQLLRAFPEIAFPLG